MVKTYRKGYMAERELVHKLYGFGYAVMRAPRSGRINLPMPDIIAIKNSKILIIECKCRGDAFSIPKEQIAELDEWIKRTSGTGYIAWKITRRWWFFIGLEKVKENRGNVNKGMLKTAIGIELL